jgi:hypothetical protein
MKIKSILLLIVSVMLVIISSWNLSIFVRLSTTTPNFPTDDTPCSLSKKYVNVGKVVSIIMLCVSIILMFGSSYNIYYL